MRTPQRAPTGTETHGFLGEEFVTWLWFRWETDGGEFQLPGGRVVGVAIDDLLTFAAASNDDTEQTLRHGLPTRTAEARTALRQGRRLRRARLILAEGARQWTVTIDGASLSLSGARLPEDAEEVESDTDRSVDRAANWLHLHEVLLGLYGLFLRERLDPGYLHDAGERQAQWMQQ